MDPAFNRNLVHAPKKAVKDESTDFVVTQEMMNMGGIVRYR